jgi:hypothetical protein
MLINLNRLVPEVAVDEEPGSLVIEFTKTEMTDAYRAQTPGLLQLVEREMHDKAPYWIVTVRPPLFDEETRIERWEFEHVLFTPEMMPAQNVIAVSVRSPCRAPRVTIFIGDEPLVTLVPTRPFDAWDGRDLLPAKTTVYDKLLEGDLICDRTTF